jgi:RecA-family ATPase
MTFKADGRGEPTPFFFQVVDAAKRFGAQIVIVDTAADTFGGNENIRPHVREFVGLLNRLAREINGAVIMLAHPSRLGKMSGSGDGASTAWSNTVRSRLYLRRLDGDGDPDMRILSREKANYAGVGVELTLLFQGGVFLNVTKSDKAAGGRSAAARRREADEAFISGLAELDKMGIRANHHKGQSNYAPRALREHTKACEDFSEVQLRGAMNRLIKSGRVAIHREGPPSRSRAYLVLVEPKLAGT